MTKGMERDTITDKEVQLCNAVSYLLSGTLMVCANAPLRRFPYHRNAGYLLCLNVGLSPNLLIGDFDSMLKPPDRLNIFHVECVPAINGTSDTVTR